jgi:hypothetical protein
VTETFEELRRGAQQRAIDAAERQYRETRNPVFAWDSFARSRADRLAIPEWVLAYFDGAARQLGSLVEKAQASETISGPADKIAAALGMTSKGAGTVFSRFSDVFLDWEWAAIGEEVAAYVRDGDKETIAIENVVKDHARIRMAALRRGYFVGEPDPSQSTITRAWKRYQNSFPERCVKKSATF